jgi:hypothetical protein
MEPKDMRRHLVGLALVYYKPPTAQRPGTDAERRARGLAPFIEALPDDDPQLAELASLVENDDDWNRTREDILKYGSQIWDQSIEYRTFLDDVLKAARIPHE